MADLAEQMEEEHGKEVGEVKILAIDPGPEESGVVEYTWVGNVGCVTESGVFKTADVVSAIARRRGFRGDELIAIEMIASYGMPVGREVFETCVWIGRMIEAAPNPAQVIRVTRNEVKVHLCRSSKAKDANIRQALLDRFGPQGTKKAPGPLYGVKSHAWAALAVAVTVADRLQAQEQAA